MEAFERLPRRSLRRAHEGSRLEQELWALAYAQLRPVKPVPVRPRPKPQSTPAGSAPAAVTSGPGG